MENSNSIEAAMAFVPTADQLHQPDNQVDTPNKLTWFPVDVQENDLRQMEGFVDLTEIRTETIARRSKAQQKVEELEAANKTDTAEYKLWATILDNAAKELGELNSINKEPREQFRWHVVYRDLIEVTLREDHRVHGFEFGTLGINLLYHLEQQGLKNYELEIDGVLTRATIPDNPSMVRIHFEPVEQS